MAVRGAYLFVTASGEATSNSTAERVAQKYGIGEEASAGVEEAEVYR